MTRAALAPYRLLEHRPELSYGDQSSPNMLIQGDNLDALKALAWSRFIGQMVMATGITRAQLTPMLQGQAPLTLDVAMRLLSELKLTVSVSPSARKDVPAPPLPAEGGAVYVRRF